MSLFQTASEIVALTRKCNTLRDRFLGFLLIGLGKMGEHRILLRRLFPFFIKLFAKKNMVTLHLSQSDRSIAFSMRAHDVADFITGGELLASSYQIPTVSLTQIIDGGGNIGAFAVIAKAQFPQAEVISFEPDKSNRNMLRRNCEANEFGVKICQKALWTSKESKYFNRPASNLGAITEEKTTQKVQCTTLPEIKNPCWLKLDIEGAEHEVIPALLQSGQYPDFISMEIHHFDSLGKKLVGILEESNYQIEGIDDFDCQCCVVNATRTVQ